MPISKDTYLTKNSNFSVSDYHIYNWAKKSCKMRIFDTIDLN